MQFVAGSAHGGYAGVGFYVFLDFFDGAPRVLLLYVGGAIRTVCPARGFYEEAVGAPRNAFPLLNVGQAVCLRIQNDEALQAVLAIDLSPVAGWVLPEAENFAAARAAALREAGEQIRRRALLQPQPRNAGADGILAGDVVLGEDLLDDFLGLRIGRVKGDAVGESRAGE